MKRKDSNHIVKIHSKELSNSILDNETNQLLKDHVGWNNKPEKKGVALFTKKDVFGNITSIRYESTIKQSLDVIEKLAFDEMLEGMPQWSQEFIQGKILKTIDEDSQVLKTQFKTPFFMKNREYVFFFGRIRTEDRLKVFYRSVCDEEYEAVPKGFIRSKLYPTIYQFTKIDEQHTKIEHILSTDLGKDMPLSIQNNGALIKGYLKANLRDCLSIKKALEA